MIKCDYQITNENNNKIYTNISKTKCPFELESRNLDGQPRVKIFFLSNGLK